MKYKNLLLSALLIICLMTPSGAIHANESQAVETEDLDISKTLENRAEKHNYNIVFNLPTQAIEEPTIIDIVFVMDTTSISSYADVRTEINSFLDHMVINNNVKLNVGVVKFALNISQASTTLTELSVDSISSIKGKFSPNYASGSNMYGGIMTGRKLLESGSAFPENKYLVIASDFGGYKSDVGDGRGLSFFYNYKYGNNGVEAIHNNDDFHGRYIYTQANNIEKEVFSIEAVDRLIRDKVFFTGTPASAETEKYLTQTGPDVGEFPDSWRTFHNWTESEKSKVIVDWTYTQRKDFPTAFEKNIYKSAHEMLDIKQTGINIIAVTSPYQPDDGSVYKRKFNAASNAFKDWFELNIGSRYEITENESFTNLLDDLESKFTYLIGKGEIRDVIASEFEVIPGKEEIILNGETLNSAILDNGDIGFGTPVDNFYPYVYHYETINGKEVVTWYINKEARMDDLLQFKFAIKLKEIPNESGEYWFDTNESAKIDYLSSKEVNDGVSDYTKTQVMPSPQAPVSVGKVLIHYIDEDGMVLFPMQSITGEVGDIYVSNKETIQGYELIKIQGVESSTFAPDIQEVIYIYRKLQVPSSQGTVIVKYEDISGNALTSTKYLNGAIGSDYSTIEKEFAGYRFVRTIGKTHGQFIDSEIEVIYVYEKITSPTSPDITPTNPDTPILENSPKLPNAGISNSNILYIACASLIIGVLVFYLGKKKKK